MFASLLAAADSDRFNAPFALIIGPGMVVAGWSAFRDAQRTCDRISAALGAPPTTSGPDRSRACYLTFRAAGAVFMLIGVGLFCVAAWHLLVI